MLSDATTFSSAGEARAKAAVTLAGTVEEASLSSLPGKRGEIEERRGRYKIRSIYRREGLLGFSSNFNSCFYLILFICCKSRSHILAALQDAASMLGVPANSDFGPLHGHIKQNNDIALCAPEMNQHQEVKECSISCIGLIVSTFGDHLNEELPACLPVHVKRMRNEITRLTAVKAFAVIAASPLQHVIAELAAFLRQANRALRQATLGTLNSLIVAYGDKIGSSAYEVIIVELSGLISDSDLHMTALALELCCTLMSDKRSSHSVGLDFRNKGQAILALQNFFATLVYSANAISANVKIYDLVSLSGVTACQRQAFTTVRWHCQTGIAFNSSMCGCSVPCCWGLGVFVHSENADRHSQG
ncbi:hypothetical protein HN873_035877 [Arachis hypogaea]